MEQTPTVQTARRDRWLLAISLAIAAVLLYFAFRDLDWATFWASLRNGNYWLLLILLPMASLNYLFRALRWRILVNSEANASVASVFWANMIGYLGNAFLPARAGELLRSAFLGKKSGLGTSFILATALTERVLDAVTLVGIGSLFLLLSGDISPVLSAALKITAILSLCGLAVILLAPFQKPLVARITARMPLPGKARDWLAKFLERFLDGTRALQNARRSATFLGITALIWFMDGLATCISAGIISQRLSLAQGLVLLAALGLSSAMPSTPGYVGIYQFIAVLVLVPFGFSRPEALVFILISQVMNTLVVSSWGLIGLLKFNKS